MTSIADLIHRAGRRFGSRVAVVDGERRLSFLDVDHRSNRLAHALGELSPTLGSRVAILMSNRLEFVEIDFAIAKAGKVKAPLNPRLADDERLHILNNCGAEILVTEKSEFDRVNDMRDRLSALRHVIGVDVKGDYEDLLSRGSDRPPGLSVDPDAASMILHTSGTTGRAKGATTSQRSRIAANVNMLLDEFDARDVDGMIHVAPMSHGSGSKILAYYVRGARNITLPRFDPDAFFTAVTTDGGTSSFMVPTMIRMLLDAPSRQKADLRRIRNLTYGGAPMPTALAEEALEAFGPVLTQVYGSCEAPHPVTVLSKQDHLLDGHAHLGTAGHETMGVEVRIVDMAGQDVEIGTPGELWVRGPNVMNGYWEDEAASEKVFAGEWYRSGDVAQRDEHGYIAIVGREREMLISGGLNVYPAEVEAVLHRHESVSEAAVIGVPDDKWGEAVTAFIVLRPGRRGESLEITDFCKHHLADYKKPRHIVFVDSLPKGTTGKVAKKELVEMATTAELGEKGSHE